MHRLGALILKILGDLEGYPCLAALLEAPPHQTVVGVGQQILEDEVGEDAHPEGGAQVGVAPVGFLSEGFGGDELFLEAEVGECCLFLVVL